MPSYIAGYGCHRKQLQDPSGKHNTSLSLVNAMSTVHPDISPGQLSSICWFRDPVCFNGEASTFTVQKRDGRSELCLGFHCLCLEVTRIIPTNISGARTDLTPHNGKAQRSIVFQEQGIRNGIWGIYLSTPFSLSASWGKMTTTEIQ